MKNIFFFKLFDWKIQDLIQMIKVEPQNFA